MQYQPDHIYHIYNRGNNKQRIFFSDENYWFFAGKLEKHLKPVCDILCWCLMPNHFHLVISATEESCKVRPAFRLTQVQELSYRIRVILSSYSQAINKQNKTTGSLFQQKTKSKPVENKRGGDYLINLIHYCHQNPWKANLVDKMEDWPYSSFSDYCGFRHHDLCNQQLLMELTGYSPEDFYADSYRRIEGLDLDFFSPSSGG